MLTTDLNGTSENDRQVLHKLLSALVEELGFAPRFVEDGSTEIKESVQKKIADLDDVHVRTNSREVNLVIVRLLSKFLSMFIFFLTLGFCYYFEYLIKKSSLLKCCQCFFKVC